MLHNCSAEQLGGCWVRPCRPAWSLARQRAWPRLVGLVFCPSRRAGLRARTRLAAAGSIVSFRCPFQIWPRSFSAAWCLGLGFLFPRSVLKWHVGTTCSFGLSEQTSHQQSNSSIFLSEQSASVISHQPNEQAASFKCMGSRLKKFIKWTRKLFHVINFGWKWTILTYNCN
jgi:hypothetical protein